MSNAPKWEDTVERAKKLGWTFEDVGRGHSTWVKVIDGKRHLFGGDLWRQEVEPSELWVGQS